VIWVRDIIVILGTVGGLGIAAWTFVRNGIELPLLAPGKREAPPKRG
jgi:hypothetical protein